MFNRLSTNTPNSKKSISNDQLSLFNNVVCLAEQGQESHQTKVTFNLTDAAAEKLLGPAEAGDDALRELGIGSLQIEEGQVIFKFYYPSQFLFHHFITLSNVVMQK